MDIEGVLESTFKKDKYLEVLSMKKEKSVMNVMINMMVKNNKTYKEFEKYYKLHQSTKCPVWLTEKEVIAIHTFLANKLKVPAKIFNERLISDALYYPIKDIIFYESRDSIFTRICNCTYLIGHTVSTCSVPLMVSVFLTLCKLNSIAICQFDDKWVKVFTDAYNKKITPDAFREMLTDIKLIQYKY